MSLFKDRILNIAILISTGWHFVFMFLINPVFAPGNIIGHRTSISFLGDILERIAPGDEKPIVSRIILMDSRVSSLRQEGPGFINVLAGKKDLSFLPSDVTRFADPGVSHKKEPVGVKFSDFFIKGEARDRLIIYRPDIDKPVMIPSDFNSGLSLDVKFKISRDGFVKYAECATSSGFPEIDQTAARYVRKWYFVPSVKDDQEGIARISFE